MAQSKYSIEINLDHPKELVWDAISEFTSYPGWNSMLYMEENDFLEVGKKFHVTIINENGKKSRFKAKVLYTEPGQSFAAQQIILGKWMFSATHHFIIEEVDEGQTRFIQTWELSGIVSKLFRKQIFAQLAQFKKMNEDLKSHLDKNRVTVKSN